MRVYITKYALTDGIQEVDDAHTCESTGSPNMIQIGSGPFTPYYHVEGREWHRTRESAVARAEEMRKKKIASLRKVLKNMEAMKF